MILFPGSSISAIGILQPLVAASLQSQYVFAQALTAAQVQRELGPLLSSITAIFGPSDPRWSNETERYRNYAPPHIQLVVQPGRESDIPIIVQYANNKSIDFFVVNRGHALTSTVGEFTGIQIDVRSLKDIAVHPNGKTARLQAGTYNFEVIETLWKNGYIATSGTCSCVGMVGPALGGGHGLFQGQYGLISDNLVSLNMVLGNGTAITVNETNNSDLWWAMLGAGHNFAIVTSFDLKIHPAIKSPWYYKEFAFGGDQLEALFENLNKFHNNGTMAPTVAGSFGVYAMDVSISKTEAVILWTFVYNGSQADAEPSLALFDQLGAISHIDGVVSYPEVSDVLGSGLTSELCAANRTHIISTAGLQVYNVTAYFDVTLKANSGLEHLAREWAAETRELWNAGQSWRRPTTYVNYAAGDESVESMYGYEPWRLQRLRGLKDHYDPENRFSYYNPIIPRE
ncbi:FAD-binding domain-containing protein [Penicillium macrosclerotiorum]|uniref:FAD-binding domain-containing protein n=1 Tax=Penicillium macrosclerotiorum TaxID=303699 RepID=UPI00254974D0|nr:FAD-binding domain-containing protein [Penicillium macrosclerotiorum]KAJ5689703.1 FAD-binding domain-containing protein [Penicillium macrosclerotiorum]